MFPYKRALLMRGHQPKVRHLSDTLEYHATSWAILFLIVGFTLFFGLSQRHCRKLSKLSVYYRAGLVVDF